MVFALNLLYSLWCSSKLSYIYEHSNIKKNFLSYFILSFPIWIVWLLICGGQYGVGTDYISYYNIFKEGTVSFYYQKGEWIFASIVDFGNNIKIPPQGFFYIFYFINFFFFYKILFELDIKYSYIFILLYICLSTVYNNQLNGLRQYTAIYIITYAVISFYRLRSYKYFFLYIIFACGIHISALLAIPFCFLYKIKQFNPFQLYILLGFAFLFALFGSYDFIINIMGNFLPRHYAAYITSEFNSSNSIMKVITKLLFVPLYFMSIRLIKKNILSEKDKAIYNLGFISYCIRLFFLENIIFNRIGQLFVLLSIFPLYYYIKYAIKKKNAYIYWIIVLIFISFYMLKVLVLAKQEYSYKSIYFL